MSLTTRTGEDSGIAGRRVNRVTTVAAALLLVMVVLVVAAVSSSTTPLAPPPPGPTLTPPSGDPLVYRPGADAQLAQRAASGSAQALFIKSPGGVVATASRVARFRPLIDAAVRGTPISPALLEGLVFLESAGRADAVAGGSVADAAGLTQILPGTAQTLLGMHVNLPASERLSAAIQAAQRGGARQRLSRLQAQRARIDQRFDPRLALAGSVRYLIMARRDLGRLDLAVVAYHAGMGNVQTVLNDYDAGRPVSYEQLYFGTAPDSHPGAWSFLSGLGDDSSLYLWRVLEAESIMRLYRSRPAELRRLVGLETRYPSSALTLLPASVRHFSSPQALSAAYQSGALRALPRDPGRLHLAYASDMGKLARHWNAPASLYRGLRPSALSTLVWMAGLVHRLGGGSLTVASTVLDARYERASGFQDPPGTTGYTFQVLRAYSGPRQAAAFQFVLDRLQALDLIAWIRGTSTIEVTVAPDAGAWLRRGL